MRFNSKIIIKILQRANTLIFLLGLFNDALNSLNMKDLRVFGINNKREDKIEKVKSPGVIIIMAMIKRFELKRLNIGSKDSNKLVIIFILWFETVVKF